MRREARIRIRGSNAIERSWEKAVMTGVWICCIRIIVAVSISM